MIVARGDGQVWTMVEKLCVYDRCVVLCSIDASRRIKKDGVLSE